uniref:Ubiquitin-like domain-containing protein n=1 Tax=Ananas comosus var. bracteatus TaxID=296719 RepID=A0A6V7PZN2_ANACO|nr:unnamed protein product [Ananas comosus var. bracteatus]
MSWESSEAATEDTHSSNSDDGSATESTKPSKIFLRWMKIVSVDVDGTSTINDIKEKVCAAERIGARQQELFFAGTHLEGDKTLADYNIPLNSTINLYVIDGMQIFVKIPSREKTIELNVRKSDTILSVKTAIREKEGVPSKLQKVMYLGEFLEDHQILIACGVKENATLHVILCPTDELHISVAIMPTKTIKLHARSWYSIADVKLMIENLASVPTQNKRLYYSGKLLQENLTLYDHKIGDNSLLELQLSPVQVFVRTWEGKTLTVLVEENETVADIMVKIEKKLQHKLEKHFLVHEGSVLQEEKTLESSGVVGNSTIQLLVRLPSGVGH